MNPDMITIKKIQDCCTTVIQKAVIDDQMKSCEERIDRLVQLKESTVELSKYTCSQIDHDINWLRNKLVELCNQKETL